MFTGHGLYTMIISTNKNWKLYLKDKGIQGWQVKYDGHLYKVARRFIMEREKFVLSIQNSELPMG